MGIKMKKRFGEDKWEMDAIGLTGRKRGRNCRPPKAVASKPGYL